MLNDVWSGRRDVMDANIRVGWWKVVMLRR